MNAAGLSKSQIAAVKWALSGIWQTRLCELLAANVGCGAAPDQFQMPPCEQFGLLLNLEKQAARRGQEEAQE
jgi:hypothetical protein